MTTVAFKNGVLAADTLMTAGNERMGHLTKVFKIGGALVSGCGSLSACQAFFQWVRSGMPDDQDPTSFFKDEEDDTRGVGIMITKDTILEITGWGLINYPVQTAAWGSGSAFAKGAMAWGASAEESVLSAMEWDTSSGGKVQTVSLEDFQSQDAK